MSAQERNLSGIWRLFEREDHSLWAEESDRVNYSITGWLSQKLFKQAPVSRGLGLITPAKVVPTTLPHCLFLQIYLVFGEISTWRGGEENRGRRKRLSPTRWGRTGEGMKSKQATTMGLNSSGSPVSLPELSQGYNYPPKCPSVARLGSETRVTLPPTEPNPSAIFCHYLFPILLLPQVSDGTRW